MPSRRCCVLRPCTAAATSFSRVTRRSISHVFSGYSVILRCVPLLQMRVDYVGQVKTSIVAGQGPARVRHTRSRWHGGHRPHTSGTLGNRPSPVRAWPVPQNSLMTPAGQHDRGQLHCASHIENQSLPTRMRAVEYDSRGHRRQQIHASAWRTRAARQHRTSSSV